MIQDRIELFRRTRNPQVLLDHLPFLQRRAWRRGAPMLQQGDGWSTAFFIEAGLLRVHHDDADGRNVTQNFYAEGTALLPLTQAMEEEPLPFSLSALEPSVVWQAPMPLLKAALGQQGLWEPLRSELLGSLLRHKMQRETELMTLAGTERYLRLCQRRPDLLSRVPLRHLASYLGLTDVSLSRIRRGLRVEGSPTSVKEADAATA